MGESILGAMLLILQNPIVGAVFFVISLFRESARMGGEFLRWGIRVPCLIRYTDRLPRSTDTVGWLQLYFLRITLRIIRGPMITGLP
jgi:hypothetical protein